MGIKQFFKNAFADMKASTKAQHEVDKANLAASKAAGRLGNRLQRLGGHASVDRQHPCVEAVGRRLIS